MLLDLLAQQLLDFLTPAAGALASPFSVASPSESSSSSSSSIPHPHRRTRPRPRAIPPRLRPPPYVVVVGFGLATFAILVAILVASAVVAAVHDADVEELVDGHILEALFPVRRQRPAALTLGALLVCPRPPRHPIDAANLISFARRRWAATFACLRRTISPRDACARTSFGSSSWAPCCIRRPYALPCARRSEAARRYFACATAAADNCRTSFSLPLRLHSRLRLLPMRFSPRRRLMVPPPRKMVAVRSGENQPDQPSRPHLHARTWSIVLGSRVQPKE